MRESLSQVGSEEFEEKTEDKTLKGYMAPRHKYFRHKYGPNCGFDDLANVFNMLEHHILGNRSVEEGIQLSRQFIAKETGLNVYKVDKALKALADKKMIQIQQIQRITPSGKKYWEESIYRLHPDKYGSEVEVLWFDEKKPKPPRLQFIPGGKMVYQNVVSMGQKEGKKVDEKPQGSRRPPDEKPADCHRPPDEKEPIPNGGSMKNSDICNDQFTGEPPPEPLKREDKNLKNSLKFSQEGEKGSRRDFEIDKTDWSQVRRYLFEKFPGDERLIDSIYRELQSRGVDDMGRPIKNLPSLMFSSFQALKEARRNPYERTEPKKVEEPIDFEAANKARMAAMNLIRKTLGTFGASGSSGFAD